MKLVLTTIPKVTAHTSRRAMWNSYIRSIADVGPEIPAITLGKQVQEVHNALFGNTDARMIRQLFKDGDTFMLVPEAMELFGGPVHREIVINDDGKSPVVVYHEDINF